MLQEFKYNNLFSAFSVSLSGFFHLQHTQEPLKDKNFPFTL